MRRIKLEKNSLAGKLLRLLKLEGGLQESISLQGDNGSATINTYLGYQKEIETAMLEAERKKAEALMKWERWQRRHFI